MDYTTLFLWAVFVFILTVFIGLVVSSTNSFLSEGFGAQCLDYLPFKGQTPYSANPGTIFVSIASYRDPECSMTLDTIFNQAANPQLIFVGICEQNKAGIKEELCVSPKLAKYLRNIRIAKLDHTEAKGPTYARYYCSELWRGEQYYLQIDSHTSFTKNWDLSLINMIRQIKENEEESDKPVLSVYPPTKEQMDIKGFPEMDNGRLSENNIPTFLCGWSGESEKPRRSNKPWAAAGFMFLESSFLYEVPFDPNLSHVFQGEETLFSARLFTNGWDFYTPNKKVCYHHYNRKSPLYHQDIKDSSECRSKAEKRVLFLLGLVPKDGVDFDFLRDYNYYGLGKFRTIDDFWKASGIDFGLRTVERWNDTTVVSEKFKGWNFRRDGYKNIKKACIFNK